MGERRLISEFILEPATGRAVPVLLGQVLRIEQIGKGHAFDFNAYNLHDYKEHFSSSRTRRMQRLHPTKGDHLWSASPRDRIMYSIIEDTVGLNDVNFPMCSAFLYEYVFGLLGSPAHSNCADIFSEAIREWGLTPDDVHDPFNGFTNSQVSPKGTLEFDRVAASEGDHIDFLAHFDTLAVPVSCGSDMSMFNNFEIKGLKIQIFDGNDADKAKLITKKSDLQRTLEQFKAQTIKVDRELRREPNFVAEWPWLKTVETKVSIDVLLDDQEAQLLKKLINEAEFSGLTEAEIIRHCFFRWWEETLEPGPDRLTGLEDT